MKSGNLIIHTDGGARGNPGPSAAAFVVESSNKIEHKAALFLGKQTNNFAEYQGVIFALDWLLKNKTPSSEETIEFYLDSELIVKQINGQYKVKEPVLKKLHAIVLNKITLLEQKVIFKNIPRSNNKIADFLVNQELDKHQ